MRKKILFVSERVTLAQVVRLVSLARAVDPRVYELHFASARFDDLVFVEHLSFATPSIPFRPSTSRRPSVRVGESTTLGC